MLTISDGKSPEYLGAIGEGDKTSITQVASTFALLVPGMPTARVISDGTRLRTSAQATSRLQAMDT